LRNATAALWRKRGVQADKKNRRRAQGRSPRASGDRLFFLKRAEGLAPKFPARLAAEEQDALLAIVVYRLISLPFRALSEITFIAHTARRPYAVLPVCQAFPPDLLVINSQKQHYDT